MGVEKRNGVVITEEGHKWSNAEYYALTGIKEYAPYMFGGGCAMSRPATGGQGEGRGPSKTLS